MKRFADLYCQIDQTMRTAEKVAALAKYFSQAPPRDAAWAVYVLSGRKIGKAISSRLLRQWAGEVSGYPDWLVNKSFLVVGDLSETLSLLLPDPADGLAAPALHELIEQRLIPLSRMTRNAQRETIVRTWSELNVDQRLVFHKLVSGNFRVGVSRQLMIRGLAEAAGIEPATIAHRLSGTWKPDEQMMARLLAKEGTPDAAADAILPYPFMLSNALLEPAETLGDIRDWFIEWKWDGIRAQLIRRADRVTLWSRGDESVGKAFPEIVQAASSLENGTVIDGEIVAWNESLKRPMPFFKLQRRLNRQSVDMTFWPEIPVSFIAFDLLELNGVDQRNVPLQERRRLLETCMSRPHLLPTLRLSEPVQCSDWDAAKARVNSARELAVEGIMLKRRDSTYRPGRPAGQWWKLKVQPFTMDAVLIAAEPGHGRRAGLLTDYTFGVWHEGELVPIAKAYSGLTDAEIADVDRFARRHTTARHGSVHMVEPTRVFEIGFEAIARSNRHKSGIAVRFPRMLRERTDKKAADADNLQTLEALLVQVEARQ